MDEILHRTSCGSHGSVASSVAEVETQQPPTQGNYIANGKIKNIMLNHMTFVFMRVEFVEHTGGGYVEKPLNHILIDGEQIKQDCY
ncbi:hypothetical protein MTR67_007118 [Solanum verrucosum]|uniref:Uncharacterized protein n=1 Tax=Solanum verrucosum TaxID=315347 RepID=A0AAF0TER3_SOLVR|nr:hypothetical protein MTR67_007118 [Solanum verrucosum]